MPSNPRLFIHNPASGTNINDYAEVTAPDGTVHKYNPDGPSITGFTKRTEREKTSFSVGSPWDPGHTRTTTYYDPVFGGQNASTPESGEGQESSPASDTMDRANQLNQDAADYADEKLEGVDDAIPGPPTSVDQGVSAKDLMIASDGDTERANQRSPKVGLNTDLKQKRRESLLSIPRY